MPEARKDMSATVDREGLDAFGASQPPCEPTLLSIYEQMLTIRHFEEAPTPCGKRRGSRSRPSLRRAGGDKRRYLRRAASPRRHRQSSSRPRSLPSAWSAAGSIIGRDFGQGRWLWPRPRRLNACD